MYYQRTCNDNVDSLDTYRINSNYPNIINVQLLKNNIELLNQIEELKQKLEQIQNKEIKTNPKNVETDNKDIDNVEVKVKVSLNELNSNSTWCNYYNYPSYLNSRECIPEEKHCTYKSYSGVGYKGKNKNPISYYNLLSRRYLEPTKITTYESTSDSSYLKYDSSNCCKLIANTCILNENVSCQNCEILPYSSLSYSRKINYILPFCPLYQEEPVSVFPILSDGVEFGGEWTLSQPGVEGKNILFTIDSKTGEIVIPEQQPLGSKLTGPEPGKYTVTYNVYKYKTYSGNGYKKYSVEWSQDLLI